METVTEATPLYDATLTARMLGIHPARVRRWLFGYEYEHRGQQKRQGALVKRDQVAARRASFLDLMELLFAKKFLDRGITVQRMRKALAEASAFYQLDHPFARRKFYTAGREIFFEVEGQQGTKNLIHLLRGGQWAIAPVIKHYARQIEFDTRTGLARQWWPLGQSVPIVVNPRHAFGEPSLAGRGIRTAVLYDLYCAEGKSIGAVERWMSLDGNLVRHAVRYEERLRAA